MDKRKKIIKYHTDYLKENEILLLKSSDLYFKNHYSSSPLALVTGFLGSAGEAIIDKSGKIKIFVDARYHLLVDMQVYSDVEVYKMNLGETFFEAIKKEYDKDTVLYVCSEINLEDYFNLDSHFDLRKYELKKNLLINNDFNKKAQIFKADLDVKNVGFLQKVDKLRKASKNISKTLIFNLDEISYLTGLRSFQMKFSSNFRSILYLDFKNNTNILFCDLNLNKNEIDGLELMSLEEFEGFISDIEDEVYVDLSEISLKNYLTLKNPKNLKEKTLSFFASVRNTDEINYLHDCFSKVDDAIFSFKKKIKAGLSEFELSKIFEEELFKTGAKELSFKTILAIGENSASIHYSQADKNKILQNESIILLDCGAYYKNGYATDITRTFYYGLNPKPVYKKVYTQVLKAFIACYLSEETDAKKLDKIARDMLILFEKEGFYFGHGLGHGIGTSVHQNPPVLSMKSKDIIKPFQVHSIEPGLYGKSKKGDEFGVRIENCVYSDLKLKKISLSKFPFEEVLIDYSLLNNKEVEFIRSWNK